MPADGHRQIHVLRDARRLGGRHRARRGVIPLAVAAAVVNASSANPWTSKGGRERLRDRYEYPASLAAFRRPEPPRPRLSRAAPRDPPLAVQSHTIVELPSWGLLRHRRVEDCWGTNSARDRWRQGHSRPMPRRCLKNMSGRLSAWRRQPLTGAQFVARQVWDRCHSPS